MTDNKSFKLKSKIEMYTLNLFFASFGLYYGYHFTIFNTLSDMYLETAHLITGNDNLLATSNNLFFYFGLGALIGTIISSFVLDIIGRRKSILLFLILSFLFPFLFIYKKIFVLYLTRFLTGIMTGINLSIPANWIYEYMPLYYRKSGTFLFDLFITIGFFIGFIFGVILGNRVGELWYIAVYSFSVIDFIKIILFFFLVKFESPVYSFYKNNNEQIESYFNYYYKEEYAKEEIEEFNKIMNNLLKENKFTFKEMFKGKYLKIFLFLSFLNLIQQLCGISTVTFYSNIIFRSTTSVEFAPYLSLIVGIITIIASSIPFFINKITRQTFLFVGMINCIVSYLCIIIGGYTNVGVLINFGVIYFSFSFSYSFGSSFYGYISAIGNTFICQISVIFQWIPVLLISSYARILIQLIGINNLFIIYLFVVFVGLIVFTGYSIDVENKSRDVIFEEFTSKRFYGRSKAFKSSKVANKI